MNALLQSTLGDTNGKQRATLTFSVEGLAAREELLFKGYVRLLDHMTEHRWQYHEPSKVHRVDLLVADERVEPTKCLHAVQYAQPVLRLGVTKTVSSPLFMAWPLKPYELETELNRIGRLIKSADALRRDMPAQALAHKPVETTQVLKLDSKQDTKLDAEPDAKPAAKRFRLRQWPKPSLLTEPGSMRLATLLTGRAMGLEEVVFRSGLPQASCERFIVSMLAAGLIMHPDADNSHISAWVLPVSKHSVQAAQNGSPAIQASSQPAAKPLVQPGLLARIRMRFGIKNNL